MASGILSTALAQAGAAIVSRILLGAAAAGLTVLLPIAVLRVVLHPRAAVEDGQNPAKAFGYFTLIAALGVLAAHAAQAGASTWAVALAAAAIPLWVVLVYAIPAGLMLRSHSEPVSAAIDGTWFLWVVGTQSVSIVVSVVDLGLGTIRPLIAVGLWSVGIVLYLILATLVLLRLLTVPNSPNTMTPSYWIFTGATAISVLAAAHILRLPDSPASAATQPFVSGAALVLWSFGTWWIPLLLVFGVWRHLVRRRPLRYEAGVWSMVFPLGMYATASMKIGDVLDMTPIHHIGRVATWVALTAWTAALLAMVRQAGRHVLTRR